MTNVDTSGHLLRTGHRPYARLYTRHFRYYPCRTRYSARQSARAGTRRGDPGAQCDDPKAKWKAVKICVMKFLE